MAKSLLPLCMRMPELNELLTYQNESVIQYFCALYPKVNPAQAQQLFKDLLAWMWLTSYRKKTQRHTFLFGPLTSLDPIWHVFILHTREYADFCSHYFGEFFHHDIEPVGIEYELSADELTEFLDDCFELLGEAWIDRYFSPAFQEA